MSQELRTALLDFRNRRFDAVVLQGMTTIPAVIFCSASGRPWTPARLHAIHRHICTLVGLRVNRIHDLRHSYATIQPYEFHAPIQYVSEQLGHSSIKITVDTYGLPTICQPRFVTFLPHLHGRLTTNSAGIIASTIPQHGHQDAQQSVANSA